MEFKDDIVAISSPPGMGAISLIRVSGSNAIKKTVTFLNLKKQKNLEKEKQAQDESGWQNKYRTLEEEHAREVARLMKEKQDSIVPSSSVFILRRYFFKKGAGSEGI